MQTCVSTLAIRHIAIGQGPISELNDLRVPIAAVLDAFGEHMKELRRYRAKYGPLDDDCERSDESVFIDEGSDTEQES